MLVTSCDPCAMCLGAALWSGGVVCLLALPLIIVCGNPPVGDPDEGFELAEELPPAPAV